ncbi:hypothetical protein MnTg02_00528 [bacterium MnTg02]|nr:hypothetical protein MnTg02_00528 [bacterium MnTg02]
MARMEMSTLAKAELAAQSGAPDALFELGMIYSTGRDVNQDLVIAHKWFNLAALRGNDAAKNYRMEIALEMNKCQVSQAQRQAREWLSEN